MATLIFGRHGFSRTKTEEIVEHAGYGQATLFFPFKTKADLLEACLDEAPARAKANLLPTENSGTIELIQRLDRAFDNSSTADLLARMLIKFGDNSTIRRAYADFHEHLRQLIAAELTRETGVEGRRAHLAAAAILAMMVGIHAEQWMKNTHFTRAAFRFSVRGQTGADHRPD